MITSRQVSKKIKGGEACISHKDEITMILAGKKLD
jgi:hypothetical protein